MAFEIFGSYKGDAMVAGDDFEVYSEGVENPAPKLRKPRSDKGKPRGARKPKVVKAEKPKGKRGPGRPRVYNGIVRRTVASYLRKNGLSKGIELLAKERKLKVSLTLCRSVAEEYGIEFKVGRPVAA